MNKEKESDKMAVVVTLCLVVWIVYTTVCGSVYLWRNPKANCMSILRDFKHVIKFEKLDTYQK